jgi:hypothetical protein
MKYLFFKRDRKAAAYRSAFWGGLWAGASAGTVTPAYSYCYKHTGSLEASWRKVGGYIYEGIDHLDSEVKTKAADKTRTSDEERVA